MKASITNIKKPIKLPNKQTLKSDSLKLKFVFDARFVIDVVKQIINKYINHLYLTTFRKHIQ